jgi:hypothetical protein
MRPITTGLLNIFRQGRSQRPQRARRLLHIEVLDERVMLSAAGATQVTVNTSAFVIAPDQDPDYSGPTQYDGSVFLSAAAFKEAVGSAAFSALKSQFDKDAALAGPATTNPDETADEAAEEEAQSPSTGVPDVTFNLNSAWGSYGVNNADPSDSDPDDADYPVNTSDAQYQSELTDLGVLTLGYLLGGQDVYLFGTTVGTEDGQSVPLSQLQPGLINSITVTIPNVTASTVTSVTSSANPAIEGDSVTFTATVSSPTPGAGTPTGSVQFAIDGSNYGAAVPLSDGTASVSDASLTADGSPYIVTALYTSDNGQFASSLGSLSLDVKADIKPPAIQLYLTDETGDPYDDTHGTNADGQPLYVPSSRMPKEGETYGILAILTDPNSVPITANLSINEAYTSVPAPDESPVNPSTPGKLVQGLTLKPGVPARVMLGYYNHQWQWIPDEAPWDNSTTAETIYEKVLDEAGKIKQLDKFAKAATNAGEAAALVSFNRILQASDELLDAVHETADIDYTVVATASGGTGYSSQELPVTLSVTTQQEFYLEGSFWLGMAADQFGLIGWRIEKLLPEIEKLPEVEELEPSLKLLTMPLAHEGKKAMKEWLLEKSEALYDDAMSPPGASSGGETSP